MKTHKLKCVVVIHSFSYSSLGEQGAEFLCSVLPLLPNLTSLRLDPFVTFATFPDEEVVFYHDECLLLCFAVLVLRRLVQVCLRSWQRSCFSPSRFRI